MTNYQETVALLETFTGTEWSFDGDEYCTSLEDDGVDIDLMITQCASDGCGVIRVAAEAADPRDRRGMVRGTSMGQVLTERLVLDALASLHGVIYANE